MEPVSVGIREFRSRLAEYLLESDRPVVVTRHGATVGYFIPARGARADLDRAALTEAAVRMNDMLRASGVGDAEVDALTKEFRTWRKSRRK
jgi:prevent-host-death family protein